MDQVQVEPSWQTVLTIEWNGKIGSEARARSTVTTPDGQSDTVDLTGKSMVKILTGVAMVAIEQSLEELGK